jgi:ABC-type uncharacterized transport system substrate-binding protein
MEPKRLGLLRELAPGAPLIGILLNPNFRPAALQLQQIEEAARGVGQRIVVARASSDEELDGAFAALVKERVDALPVAADPYFGVRRERIVALAARQRLPAIYQFREFAVANGLLSYGINLPDIYRRLGGNVTGFAMFEFSMGGKWLDLLKKLVPSTKRIAVLFNPPTPAAPFAKLYFQSIAAAE